MQIDLEDILASMPC